MDLKKFIRPGMGAADISPLLADPNSFSYMIDELAKLVGEHKSMKIACVEGRGMIVGSAVAYKLHMGVITLRRAGKLKNETYAVNYVDYSGKNKTLEILTDALQKDEPVILIDDWVETGATIMAGIELVKKCGGTVESIVVFMDDSSTEFKNKIKKHDYQFLQKVGPKDNF